MLKIFSRGYLHDETGVRYVIVVSWVGIHQGDSVKYDNGIFLGGSSIFVKRLSCLAYFSSTSVLLVVKLCKRNIGIHIRLWSIQPSHLNLEVKLNHVQCYLRTRSLFHVDWFLLACLWNQSFQTWFGNIARQQETWQKTRNKTVRPRIFLSPQKNLRL